MPSEQTSQSEISEHASRAGTDTGQASADRSGELRAFLGSLLAFQCRLTGATAGAVYLRAGQSRTGGLFVAYHENDDAFDESTVRKLESIGARASESGSGSLSEPITLTGAHDLYAAGATHTALAAPLCADGKPEGASIVLVPRAQSGDEAANLERLALSSARFESYLWRQSFLVEAEHKVKLRETLELLDRAQRGSTARAMASLLCDELRRRFGCTRVSIGLIRRDHLRVLAVSGSDELDRHAPAVEALEATMEETALQDAEVLYPPTETMERNPALRRVTHEHARLSEAFGPSSIVSLPLRIDTDLVGVIVLERDASDPFPEAVLPLFRLVAEFIGPAIYTRRLADRRTPEVFRDDLLDLGAGIVGPRHTAKKLVALVAIVALVGLTIIPIPAHVGGSMELSAETSRAVVPPFAGFLESFNARPGDEVHAGQVLARMDTSELTLKLAELTERLKTLQTQRDNAMAEGKLAEARQHKAEMDETQASIDLIRERLRLSELRSPIDGVVSRGDLEKLVGAPVDASKALFEVVGEGVRVVIEVDERDAGRVKLGQRGWIASRARPGVHIPITVSRINPVAQPKEGANVYLVEAEVEDPPDWLRPGMTGSARLRDGWSTPMWEIARPLVDAFHMWTWL